MTCNLMTKVTCHSLTHRSWLTQKHIFTTLRQFYIIRYFTFNLTFTMWLLSKSGYIYQKLWDIITPFHTQSYNIKRSEKRFLVRLFHPMTSSCQVYSFRQYSDSLQQMYGNFRPVFVRRKQKPWKRPRFSFIGWPSSKSPLGLPCSSASFWAR